MNTWYIIKTLEHLNIGWNDNNIMVAEFRYLKEYEHCKARWKIALTKIKFMEYDTASLQYAVILDSGMVHW